MWANYCLSVVVTWLHGPFTGICLCLCFICMCICECMSVCVLIFLRIVRTIMDSGQLEGCCCNACLSRPHHVCNTVLVTCVFLREHVCDLRELFKGFLLSVIFTPYHNSWASVIFYVLSKVWRLDQLHAIESVVEGWYPKWWVDDVERRSHVHAAPCVGIMGHWANASLNHHNLHICICIYYDVIMSSHIVAAFVLLSFYRYADRKLGYCCYDGMLWTLWRLYIHVWRMRTVLVYVTCIV